MHSIHGRLLADTREEVSIATEEVDAAPIISIEESLSAIMVPVIKNGLAGCYVKLTPVGDENLVARFDPHNIRRLVLSIMVGWMNVMQHCTCMKTASKHNTANKHQCLLVVGYIGSTKHFRCSNVIP